MVIGCCFYQYSYTMGPISFIQYFIIVHQFFSLCSFDRRFHTILGHAYTPGILETADLLLATQTPARSTRPVSLPGRLVALVGGILIVIPLLLPVAAGGYLFGLVWLGFAFLLDPLNCEAGRASIVGDLRHGDRRRLRALVTAGVICGFGWEFWNSWATAKWVYIFPILQQVKIFEMPLPGYLGFPAFALEVFAMSEYVTGRLAVPSYEVG